jgi:hypothetical protein
MIIDLGCVAFALGAPDGTRLLGDGRPARTVAPSLTNNG